LARSSWGEFNCENQVERIIGSEGRK